MFSLCTILFLLSLCNHKVLADTDNAQENNVTNVLDNAHVFSQKDIAEINKLNNNELSNVYGKPQLAVVTVKKTDSIEDYAQNLFDKYHFGRKSLDNGVLLILAIDNHKIRIQTGYGVEDALPDTWCGSDAVNGKPKEYLRNKEYGLAAITISKRIVNRLQEQEGQIKTKKQVLIKQNSDKMTSMVLEETSHFLGFSLLIILSGAVLYLLVTDIEKRKFIKRVLSTKIAKKYGLTASDLSNNYYDDYLNFIYEHKKSDINLEAVAAFLVVVKDWRDNSNNLFLDTFYMDDLFNLVLVLESDLSTLLKVSRVLSDNDNVIETKLEHDLKTEAIALFNDLLSQNTFDGKAIYHKVNKQKLIANQDVIIDKVSTQYDKTNLVEKLFKTALTKPDITPNKIKFKFNTDTLRELLATEITQQDKTLLFDLIDHDPNVIDCESKLANSFTADEAYDNLSQTDRKKVEKYLNSGQMALASALIVNSLIELNQVEEVRKERVYNDNDHDDSDFGDFDNFDDSGNFGDFGGFGGDSGGGGATSDW